MSLLEKYLIEEDINNKLLSLCYFENEEKPTLCVSTKDYKKNVEVIEEVEVTVYSHYVDLEYPDNDEVFSKTKKVLTSREVFDFSFEYSKEKYDEFASICKDYDVIKEEFDVEKYQPTSKKKGTFEYEVTLLKKFYTVIKIENELVD